MLLSQNQTTEGSFALGVVMVEVVVYFLWFYFHGNAIVKANYNQLLPPSSSLLHVVNHPYDGCCSCSTTRNFMARNLWGESKETPTQHCIPNPHKENNYSNFLDSIHNLNHGKGQPHHHPQP